MGIIGSFFGRGSTAPRGRVEPRITNVSPENPSTSLGNPDAWFAEWASGGAGAAFGPLVSEQSAMRVSTVFRCVSILSGLIAAVPLKVYSRDEKTGERIEAPGHRLAPLLSFAPFPGRSMTSFVWRELWAVNMLLWGNHYSIIRYDGAGRVVGFEAIMPWKVEVLRRNNVNWYRCQMDDQSVEMVHQEDMLHIVGPGFDGVKGLSRIQAFARTAVGLAVVLEEQSGVVHENAAKPSGVVTLPRGIQPDGKRRIEAYFNDRSSGRANAGRTMFIDADQKYSPMQMTPEDLGTLEHRRYTSADICRFFGVPPHLAGEAAGTSAWGSGIEQLTIGFLAYTLEPEFQRIEHELRLKLFSKGNFYPEFDRERLQTMDAKNAADIRQTEINSGQLTPNEARRARNRPRVEGGDELLVNGTMIPLSRALNPPPPASAPPAKDPAK